MQQQTSYAYRCAACRNSESGIVAKDSQPIDAALCAACGERVTLVPTDPDGGFLDPYVAAWWDESMSASLWWNRASVEAAEVALLGCRINPHDDPLAEPADPRAYRILLREFTGIQEAEPGSRTLSQWLQIARDRDLKFDDWIEQWARAAGIELSQAKVAGTTADGPSPIPSRLVAVLFAGNNRWDQSKWARNLGDPPRWLAAARVQKGRRASNGGATWDPVRIAVALSGMGVPRARLDKIFEYSGLDAWRGEWNEKREYLR